METSSNIERLNVVARAVGAEELLPLQRPMALLIAAAVVLALVFSTRGDYAPFITAGLAVSGIPALGGLWSDQRYKFFFAASWWFAAAVAIMVLASSEPLGDRILFACYISLFGMSFLTVGGSYAHANSPGWEHEQAVVQSCWEKLATSRRFDDVTELSTKDLLYGVQTYRMMRQGGYWAVFRERRRLGQRLADLNFYELRDVDIITAPSGERTVRIGKKTMRILRLSEPNEKAAQGAGMAS